jgi:hypothetical protein
MGNSLGVSLGHWPEMDYYSISGVVLWLKSLLSNDFSYPEHQDDHHHPWMGETPPPAGGRGNLARG